MVALVFEFRENGEPKGNGIPLNDRNFGLVRVDERITGSASGGDTAEEEEFELDEDELDLREFEEAEES